MGNYYHLVNFDKKEYITFKDGAKEREFNHNQPRLIVHYLFENNGDRICFIGDEWNIGIPFECGTFDQMIYRQFKDVTQRYEDSLKEVLES